MVKHEGKPVLLADQIQSDAGQLVREKGVRDEAKIAELKKRKAELEGNVTALNEQAYQLIEKHDGEPGARNRYAQPARELGTSYGMRQSIPDGAPIFDAFKKNFQDLELVDAELRTAEASPNFAEPLKSLTRTTDQWVNTTLRRAIRQAAEADASYIAIPHGDTVLSYNPGDADGMRGFYGSRTSEGIVPKNLRKLIEKLDKDAPKPTKVDNLDAPSGPRGWQDGTSYKFDESQTGFTLFPLTDKIKAEVLDDGQPLFAFGTVMQMTSAERGTKPPRLEPASRASGGSVSLPNTDMSMLDRALAIIRSSRPR
jgi:hypothetical protein